MRGQHIHSGKEEHAVGDGKQELVQWTVDSTHAVVLRRPADGNAQERSFSLQAARAIAVPDLRTSLGDMRRLLSQKRSGGAATRARDRNENARAKPWPLQSPAAAGAL